MRQPFEIDRFQITIDFSRTDFLPEIEATVKISTNNQSMNAEAAGDTPLTALNKALGRALTRIFRREFTAAEIILPPTRADNYPLIAKLLTAAYCRQIEIMTAHE